MAIGNLYRLKTWIQREADPLALTRWALSASKIGLPEDIRLNRINPSDMTNEETFALLKAEAERIVGKTYVENSQEAAY